MEALSGLDLSAVQVHRNSPKPRLLGARAFTQANHIYLGPSQERSLPHEFWHAVQQKQNRVRATAEIDGTAINQNQVLEKEADAIGEQAARDVRSTREVEQIQKRKADARGVGTSPASQSRFYPIQMEVLEKTKSDELNTPAGAIKEKLGIDIKDLKPGLGTQPGGKKFRAEKVEATITKDTLRDIKIRDGNTGAANLKAINQMARAEQNILQGARTSGEYHAGHLVADQLIADGVEKEYSFNLWNLAPQVGSLNTPIYSTLVEERIKTAINGDKTGKTQVKMMVEVEYSDPYTMTAMDLVDRKIISEVPEGKDKGTQIEIPRRVPFKWKAEATAMNTDPKSNKSKFFPEYKYVEKEVGDEFDKPLPSPLPGKPYSFYIDKAEKHGKGLKLLKSMMRTFEARQLTPSNEVPKKEVLMAFITNKFRNLGSDSAIMEIFTDKEAVAKKEQIETIEDGERALEQQLLALSDRVFFIQIPPELDPSSRKAFEHQANQLRLDYKDANAKLADLRAANKLRITNERFNEALMGITSIRENLKMISENLSRLVDAINQEVEKLRHNKSTTGNIVNITFSGSENKQPKVDRRDEMANRNAGDPLNKYLKNQ